MDSFTIYPKQFRNAKIPVEKNRCFIFMPFNERFDEIYGHIKKALNDHDYVCNRADEILGSKPIMNKILIELLKAQFVIADLTTQSPNVFYELGIAHTFKDPQNIISITQRVEDIPFDIRHINNIVYHPNNMKYLTSTILKTLDESKYLMSFHEALQQRNIIDVIHDNKEEFVDYFQTRLRDLVPVATKILNNDIFELKEPEINSFFEILIHIINDAISEGSFNYLTGIMKVMFESLVVCNKYSITDKITYDFLYGNLITINNIPDREIVSYQTDLAVCLASYRVKFNTVISWIINYFSNSKSATIDLNRYKVERFLMTSNDKLIDNAVIDAIFHKNCYIREHLADIVGEKKLYEASDALISQLLIEENFFTAVSIISAIGKLGTSNGAEIIMQWLKDRIDIIVKTNSLFVLKHSQIALSRLDKANNTDVNKEFKLKYGDYIKGYFIL